MSLGREQGRRVVSAPGRWEPYEARVSRTVLRGPGGEAPPGYSLRVNSSDIACGDDALKLDALNLREYSIWQWHCAFGLLYQVRF